MVHPLFVHPFAIAFAFSMLSYFGHIGFLFMAFRMEFVHAHLMVKVVNIVNRLENENGKVYENSQAMDD
jgi:hypothetical protein